LPLFRIDLSAPTFVRDLKDAQRAHASIREDLAETFAVLEQHYNIGDWIPGVGAHVRKIRVGVKKARISKQKGYRLIYFVDIEKNVITPLLLHYKPDIALVPPKEVAKVVKAMLEKQAQDATMNVSPPPGMAN
jgi:mRNA-degrading endonuclease RelE of RelBE toxin-antitoxin system